jgi:hypothetical protein
MSIAQTFKITTLNLIKKEQIKSAVISTTCLGHEATNISIDDFAQELYEKELLPICRNQVDKLQFYYDFPWILSDKIINLFKTDGFNIEFINNENIICQCCLGRSCYFCQNGNTTRISWK